MSDCRLKIGPTYSDSKGKGKLSKGKVGRRSKLEDAAYASARVISSGAFKRAGVKVPDARGGDTSQARTPRASASNAKANTKAKAAANDTKPVTIKAKSGEEMVRYALV